MTTMYTDAAREERYGRLRAKRNFLEKWHDRLAWVAIFTIGLGMIASIMGGVLYGLFISISEFFTAMFDVAEALAVFYALYKRDYRITAGVLIGYVLLKSITLGAFGGMLSLTDLVVLMLIAELIIDIQWHKLSQEEGFPLFDITYAEREERKQLQEEIVRNRAINQGVRVAATEQTSDMGDLLDAGFDAPVLPPHLSARHERSGLYATPGTQAAEDFDAGKMAMLEEIGAPPRSGQSNEMDEL